MGRKLLLLASFLWASLAFVFFNASAVRAVESPVVSCGSPSGAEIANHSEGNHGVPGNSNTYGGTDVVYDQGQGNALQCLCVNGSGIQTTWWNVSGKSTEEIQGYVNQGWIYIPNGSNWGLAEAPYLALNSNYSCGGSTKGSSSSNDNPGAPVCNDVAPKSAPTLLSAVTNADNSVTLTWSPAADPVSYYLVAYGTTPGNYIYGNPNVGGHDTTSYTVKGLSGGVTYYFVVRAGNGCMPGPFSNSLSSQPTGGAVEGAAVDFTPEVLAATSDTPALFDSIQTAGIAVCGCVWLPIIIGEFIVLIALLWLVRKDTNWKKKMVAGFLISVIAYIVFLIWNRNCTGGIMNLILFKLPCKYFWLLAGMVWLLVSLIFKKLQPKKK